MQRNLIINADDFGLTKGINAAISECAQAGVLRSATIMPNGEAFDDAVQTAKGLEGFGTGIHFVLTGLKPLIPAERLPGLVGPGGFLPSGPGALLKKIAAQKVTLDEIRKELIAQAEKVYDSGIVPTHFDSHKHVHIIPMVLDIILDIARRFSIKWVRKPFEASDSWMLLPYVEKGERPKFIKQYAAARASILARPFFNSRIRKAGIRAPDTFYGISPTGFMNVNIIKSICYSIEQGVTEIMMHPGILDSELLRMKTRLLFSREKERKVLASGELKEFFYKKEIILSHFGEVNR